MNTVYTRQDLVMRMKYICVFLLVTQAEQTSAQCTVGYTGPDGDVCAACPVGTYKNMTGSANCTVCVPGNYSAIGSVFCTDTCPAGLYPIGSACTACPADTYKDILGNALCTPCGAGSYSTSGAVSCTHMPAPTCTLKTQPSQRRCRQ
jgi:hypothetical protein